MTSGGKDIKIKKQESDQLISVNFCKTTGLPTKNETSETTVRNLYCLFPYIYNSLQLYTHVSSLSNHEITGQKIKINH